MAPMILSDDLYGELEDLVLHTPLAKEGCRAQAVLWLAEGLPAEQIADTFRSAVRPSITGRNDSASAKGSTSGHASSTPHARAALP